MDYKHNSEVASSLQALDTKPLWATQFDSWATIVLNQTPRLQIPPGPYA